MEPLPPELQALLSSTEGEGEAAPGTDPLVRTFLRRQRRLEELQRRRLEPLGQRLARFATRKYFLFRRR